MTTTNTPTKKVPNVFWHSKASRWATKIGYNLTKTGKRDRAVQYHGRVKSKLERHLAESAALDLARKWGELGEEWAEYGPQMALIAPEYDWSQPVWLDSAFVKSLLANSEASVAQRHQDLDQAVKQVEDMDREMLSSVLKSNPQFVEAAVNRRSGKVNRTITLQEALERYQQATLARVNLTGRRRINGNTADGYVRHARLGMAGIDSSIQLSAITYKTLERLVDHWFAKDRSCSPRTAKDYCLGVKRVLDWAAEQDDLDYEFPKKAEKLFCFEGASPVNIAAYNPEHLIAFRDHAPERTWLFSLFALNCGYYQSDIGLCRVDQIVRLVEGKPVSLTWEELKAYDGSYDIYTYRVRTRTQRKNADNKALHWLFPELGKLLAGHLAPKNDLGLVLLSNAGTPLYRDGDGKRADTIGRQFRRDCVSVTREIASDFSSPDYCDGQDEETELTLKQFRKLGSSKVAELAAADSDYVVRLYRGKPPEGDAKFYVIDAYQQKLTPVLQLMRAKLMADKVISF